MRLGRLLLIVVMTAAVPVEAAGIEGFKHSSWTAEQGAPSNVVAIAQTPDGYLWLASAEGVYRFDGLSFEHIAAPRGERFTTAIPTSIFADQQGRLWVGFNQNAGVAVYRQGRLHAVPMTATPPAIMKFAQTGDGAIWVSWGGQGDRLFRYKRGSWQMMDRALELPAGEIASLAVTADDSLWVTLGRSREVGSLLRLERNATRFRTEPDRIGFTMLAVDPDGSLWISDRVGTRIIRDRRGTSPVTRRTFAAVPGAAVPSLAFDRRGGIWGTTRGVGLFRGDLAAERNVERLEVGRLLTSDATIATFADREGNIWVASDAGLDRYRAVAVSRIPSIPPDVQDGIKLANGEDGTVYVASNHSLYSAPPNRPVHRVRTSLGRIGAMCAAVSGGIWVVRDGAVARYSGVLGQSVRLPPDPVAPTACAQDRSGRLWINGESALWMRENGSWRRHPVDLRGKGVLDIVADPNGEGIFVNTGDAALLRLDGVRHGRVPVARLGIGVVSTLWSAGGAVYASGAGGIASITGRGLQRVKSVSNPWLVGVRGMAIGADGAAWFLVRLGIARVPLPDLERGFAAPGKALAHRLFDTHDGYETRGQALSFRGAQVTSNRDGRIFFATRVGTLVIDPADITRDTSPPPIVIRGISAGKLHWRDPPAALRLREGTRSIRIAFAINSLAVPTRNRAYFRLEGQDSGWTAAGARREATYTNLGPGRYTFRVIGANGDGVWNRAGPSLTIEIPPTFLQSWKFKVLCAAVLAMLMWLAYRVRLRILTREIRSRLLDRLRERERVARDIHDTLLQSIQALMLRFQIAADELPTSHPARQELENAMDRADEVVAEGRDRLRDLRQTEGTEDPEAALREIAGRQLAGAAIRLTVQSAGTARPLDAMAWSELSSIAAEVMFNVARHSHASEMIVEIGYRTAGLTLRISDNGVGIPADIASTGRRGHYGIPGMHERAARIGGSFSIGRRHDGGTEAVVTVPATMVYHRHTKPS